MDNWDDYRFILALHRSVTLRGAAKYLGVNHSTISRRLAALNRRSGGAVFEQAAGGYRATSLGAQLVSAAEQIEEISFAAERQERAHHKEISGPITLSIPEAIGRHLLLDDLLEFDRLHPDIELNIRFSYRFADLDKSEADIVVRGTNAPADHLVGRRLFPYALCFYGQRDYLARTARDDLRWISAAPASDNPAWLVSSPYPDAPIGLVIDDVALRHVVAASGHGLIAGACYIADQDADMVRLPGAVPFPHQDLWVLTHPDLKNTPRIRALSAFISSALTSKRRLIEGHSPQI